MMKVLGAAAVFSAGRAQSSSSGSFSAVTYNVAGLPLGISAAESPREEATEIISCYVNQFNFVAVQEDFNYHAALYDACNDHPYRTPTTGGIAVGNGLNFMSRYSFADVDSERQVWEACEGLIDECAAAKGFDLMRVRLDEGVYVDMYNLHNGAKTDEASLAARRSQNEQLLTYIESNSAGNAVILLGDFNSRWTREGDNLEIFTSAGFGDPWVEILRNDDYPQKGNALACGFPPPTTSDCEIVDKFLYRDNGFLNLNPTSFEYRLDALYTDGTQLSDHPPVHVDFEWSLPANFRMSDVAGGNGGTSYNDFTSLGDSPRAAVIGLRAGSRLDQLYMRLTSGTELRHGGEGGDYSELVLGSGEYVSSARFCIGERNGSDRIFYAEFTTNQGRSVSGGSTTGNCVSFEAPSGMGIVGFHGKNGADMDQAGVIYGNV